MLNNLIKFTWIALNPQVQIGDVRVVQTLDTNQGWTVDVLVLSEQVIPNLSIAVDGSSTWESFRK